MTVNVDSHVRYLEMIWQDKSLYPNRNVILGTRLIEQLRKNGRNTEADTVQAIMDKGFSSHAPGTFPTWTLQSFSPCILSVVYRKAMVTCLTAWTTTTETTRISVFMTWYLSRPCDAYALPGRLRSTTVCSRPQ